MGFVLLWVAVLADATGAAGNENADPEVGVLVCWRRERDSNPRCRFKPT
jgi:hypothetical protein